MSTLTPSLFPDTSSRTADARTEGTVVPFGITRAVPVEPQIVGVQEDFTLCPDRQISVTHDGIPFLSTPSMGSSIATKSKTREDMQVWDDNHGTDKD